ncbi:MAG: RNA polymerase factor sigma-54 [Chthoniobacterales bacterium]
MAQIEQSQQIGLQHVLSPQMRQSLNVLQAPITELRQMVEQELQTNPMLEEEPVQTEDTVPDLEEKDNGLEDEWRDWLVQAPPEQRDYNAEERRQHFFESLSANPTLQEHLLEQLSTTDLDPNRRKIGEALIGNLNEEGYLLSTLEEIALQLHVEFDDVRKVLQEIQSFDPAGVAARDLRECLLIQLKRKGRQESFEYRIVENYLDQLARKKLPEIAKHLHVKVEEVQEAAEEIALLNPSPGRNFSSQADQIVSADLTIEWDGDQWQVILNDRQIPALRIGNTYKDMLSTPDTSGELRGYLQDKIREGKFFIRCIQQRQGTLLRIGKVIAERQKDFFEKGVAYLHPMTMAEVAGNIGVHETTISRAVAGKYISTPHGLFEMKYFFASGYNSKDGETVSNKSVQSMIAQLIEKESSTKPLSDQAIGELLVEKGIPIARRTISKYREELGILPSHLRRKFSAR